MSTLVCIFCGVCNPASYKQVGHRYVQDLVQTQKDAGVSEPVLDFMWNTLQREDLGAEAELYSCMCCYYWIERRRNMLVIPLPMQTMLWFLKMLNWCEGLKCDNRILQRLVETVVEPGNAFAGLFDECEMLGLQQIAGQIANKRISKAQTSKAQSTESFCVKQAIAALWREQNGNSLLLPHSHAADLMRKKQFVEEI